ncbi:MAG: hypothetical protein EOP49_26120 [Sphingobacteriales bacterium]|nr:MAG: hypothetical protein EOP49_26120 [Sphingobacteriales bacterium]
MQTIRDNRSSESNFSVLQQELDKTLTLAEQSGDSSLLADLQEIKEKYASEYQTARSGEGTGWPAYEKFVTQFERVLMSARKG